MAFNVRVFGYRGTLQIPSRQDQFTGDSVFVIDEPYEWQQLLVANGATPPAFATQNPDRSRFIRVEVPDNQKIRYEINPPGRAVVVNVNSPSCIGYNNFPWGLGWSFSIADATAFAS